MRTWFITIGLALIYCSAMAQEKEELLAPSFFKGTLSEANEIVLTEEKKFFVVLYETEEHELLKHFREHVFTDSTLLKVLDRDFVCLYEQRDSDNGKKLCKQFGVDRFPIILFVSEQGELLHRIISKLDPDQMVDELRRKVFND